MPGITLVSRKTMNSVCNCSSSRGSNPMCRRESHIQLSQEEQNAAEESLSAYCKPVELYNILQRRAISYPLFLQRCLRYKLQAKNKRRLQISVSLSGAINDGTHTQSLFPLYILLARPLSTTNMERSAVYHFSKASKLTAFGAETVSCAQANFILPEINKLSAEIKSGSLAMLLVSCVDVTDRQEIDLTKDHMFSFSSNVEGYCLLGQIPMDLRHFERSSSLSLREKAEMTSSVSMRSCYTKLRGLDDEKCVSFQFPDNSEAVIRFFIFQQVPVIISAEEVGAKDVSAYDSYSFSDIPDNSQPRIMRMRTGNVIFNYKYYNDMLQRTEVTEEFSCPFCLVRCASYKGLRFHLTSSHDLFCFEFWADTRNSEIAGDGIDPRKQTFSFCYNPVRSRKRKEGSKNDTNSPNTTCISSGTGASFAEPDFVQSGPDASVVAPPLMLQFAKTRKLSAERFDPRNQELLQKRQFFHSHRAQPMAVEQVFAEQDSEDEVDDDVADLEDRRMLDDFLDVTSDEKQMMHLWNSFVRKQRVLAEGHTPWACEAFSKLHGQDFVQNPALLWCWRLFMIKLWNDGLLDQQAMNNCNLILQHYQNIHHTNTPMSIRRQPKSARCQKAGGHCHHRGDKERDEYQQDQSCHSAISGEP